MNPLKKTLAAALALGLIHASLAPAAVAASREIAVPGGAPIALAAGLPSLPASLPGPAAPYQPASFAAALTPAASPRTTPEPAARPALEAIAAQAPSLAASAAPAAAARLDRHYEGSAALSAGAEPVLAVSLPPSSPSGLTPSGAGPRLSPASASAPGGGRRRNSQRGAVNVKLLAIIGGAVVVVALVVGLILHGVSKGNAKDKVWSASRASADVVEVERARRGNDAETLFKVAGSARARQNKEHEEIADARSRHAGTTASGDSVDKAEALEAFDGLAGLRAETNANAVSADAARRVGGETLSAWTDRLSRSEAEARRDGGSLTPLAKDIATLRTELAKEASASERFDGDLRRFDGQLPSLGGALLKEQASKARADLGEFKKEVSEEQTLLSAYTGKLRAVVTDNLARSDASFRAHLVHHDRLATIGSGPLASFSRLADSIDKDLSDMARYRHDERENRKLAEDNRWVQAKDANGNPVYDKDGKPVMEDRSAPYTQKADQAAIDAVAAARSALSNIEAFNRSAADLRRSPDIQAEDLAASLPSGANNTNMDMGSGIYSDLLDPDNLRYQASRFSEAAANDARARFGTVRGKVQAAQATVDARLKAEQKAIDERVDAEVKKAESGAW